MKKKRRKKNNVRYSKLFIMASLFLFAVMILRLLQLSTATEIDGTNLKELADKRTMTTKSLPAQRGVIYDSRGEVLAQNVASYKLIAYLSSKRTTNKKKPQHVVDKEKTATELAPILGMDKEEILKYLNKDLYQTEFGTKGKNLNEITKDKIEKLNLPGLAFEESYKRYYPKGNFLSYTLGYAKTTEKTDEENKETKEKIVGEMGLEKYYDKILSGEDGYVTFQKDLRGYQIANTKELRKEAIEGKDVYLTVDSSIQFYVEQALAKAKGGYGFEWFTIVIADAKTGKILAISQSPSFDPNKKDIENYLNVTTSYPYEPGSTMKTFTYMAAMENGVYNGSETYKSGVFVTSDGTEIGDHERSGWGVISFDRGYALSSNVGIINLIHRHMNASMLRQYYKKLGFGSKTGISLPNEAKGQINFKYETEIYNAGFGQGITVTPLQMIQALTPLTNDGMLLKPYIVDKIVDPTTKEEVFKGERTEIEKVASTETVTKIKSLMDDTVNGLGNTGMGFRIDSGELIGKTGTAQIAGKGGYLEGEADIISSFTGIYPKSNPKIIIYAAASRPGAGKQSVVFDTVKSIVNNLSQYYGQDKEEDKKVKEYKLPSFKNKDLNSTIELLNQNGITNHQVIGKGTKVINQYPSKKVLVSSDDTIYLITNDSNITVPNVTGLSSKEAKSILKMLGIKVKLNGSGYVTKQSIAPNTQITDNTEITLELAPKFK